MMELREQAQIWQNEPNLIEPVRRSANGVSCLIEPSVTCSREGFGKSGDL